MISYDFLKKVVFSLFYLGCITTPIKASSLSPLMIRTDKKDHTFYVEVVRSSFALRNGLMNRKSLPKDHGMLFVFSHPDTIQMWMKNTLMPLDMIFIKKDGKIVHIKENALPGSLEKIKSPVEVIAVLEINGGLSTTLGLKTGDQVIHMVFSSSNVKSKP